jgi:signal transduction histidine kinase
MTIIASTMRRIILPRYFILSVLLLLALVSVYIFFEARRLQGELLRQTEAKGLALADAIETNIRSSVLGNSLLEELISQRLLDNARLIDQLLRFPPVDRTFLQQVAALNGLRKIDLLDPHGQPLGPELPGRSMPQMQGMMARMKNFHPEESPEQRQAMMTFMWGRRWHLPQERSQPPPKIAERKFWEGSVFGVAIGARSFSGIIAVHADADYIVNFRKEIDLQKQVEELGRQPDIEHVVLVDNNLMVLAHTDPRRINQQRENLLLAQIKSDGEAGRIVHESDGSEHYDIVKPVTVNGARFGFLEIGLSLQPMEAAWHRTLRSMLVFGFAVLAVGISGMAVIFYNQQNHLRRVRSLEAEISRKERLSELGNLAATVAHEIRNPLNSVSIGLQRLKTEFSPTQDQDDYAHFLNLMQDEVRRLNGIVEQFLSLARPLNLNREDIAVGDFVKEVAALMAGDTNSANVRIELNVAPNLPLLHADRNFLKQLLLNLILNGIQAMPRGGALTVEASADKDFVKLAVTDTGIGIAPQTLEKIFEPYFTTKTTGSGLGLAISRRIVEAHGGTIGVESEPQRGSRFLVRLPFRPPEA